MGLEEWWIGSLSVESWVLRGGSCVSYNLDHRTSRKDGTKFRRYIYEIRAHNGGEMPLVNLDMSFGTVRAELL